jgi:hypothetical protein
MNHFIRCLVLLPFLVVWAGCKTPQPKVSVVGLWPEEPQLIYVPVQMFGPGNFYKQPVVDSLQPTLRWESFPRPLDFAAGNPALNAAITNVTYDLRIWQCQNKLPPGRIYERTGLRTNSHRLEQSLQPNAIYAWSIRARFQIQDSPRVTDWSRIDSPSPAIKEESDQFGFPNERSFKFRTPK